MLPGLALTYLLIFGLSSLIIWYGTGLVVTSISSLARSLKISAFTISFFVLGLMTSMPEFMIGLTAVSRGEPGIMVGSLIGASLVLFLLVIPLLAIFGGKVILPHTLHRKELIFSLLTILAPTVMIADRTLTIIEGIFLVIMYLGLFIALSKNEGFFEKIRDTIHAHKKSHHRMLKIIAGLALIFISARGIVASAEYFAVALGWSQFIVGLLIVSIGTNIPELSLVARTVFSKKSDIALADYIGSAASNSLLIGIFIILNQRAITLPNHTFVRFTILLTSLVLFYIFIRSKHALSRRESLILLILYIGFIVIEIGQA